MHKLDNSRIAEEDNDEFRIYLTVFRKYSRES